MQGKQLRKLEAELWRAADQLRANSKLTASEYSMPTLLCFNFFPTAQNILKFYANPQMAHLVLPDTQADPSQNQKSHFLPPHQRRLCDLKL